MKNDRRKIKVIYSGFYISIIIGMTMNVVFFFFEDSIVIGVLYRFTVYFVSYCLIFLLIFFICYYNNEMDTIPKKRWMLFAVYAVLFLFMAFNPGEVWANEGSNWAPIIDLTFLVIFIVILMSAIVPLYYFIFKILGTFEEKVMRRRWKLLIVGISELVFFFIGITVANFLNLQSIRILFSILALILVPTGSYFIYYAVARKYVK